MLKVVVVGNCQARPVAELMGSFCSDVHISYVAIAHLIGNNDESEFNTAIAEADYIVTQKVDNDYPCLFIHTSKLKEKYPEKVKVILNLYCMIYDPDWFYFRFENRAVLPGPIGEYHNKTIYDSWLKGLPINEVLCLLNSTDYNNKLYGDVFNQSLAELKRREESVDVKITDYIVSEYNQTRLFHTFNHPTSILLEEYVNRILLQINKNLIIERKKMCFEPLGRFSPKVNVQFENLSISLKTHKGVEAPYLIHPGLKNKVYNDVELISSFYNLYNQKLSPVKESEMKSNLMGFDGVMDANCSPSVNEYLEIVMIESSLESVDVSDRPNHCRVTEDKLRTPKVSVKSYRHVKAFGDSKELKKKETPGGAVVLNLFTPGAVVYTHWIFDLLPKIKLVLDAGYKISDFDMVIVNGTNQKFQISTLTQLGFDLKKVHSINEFKTKEIACKELVQVDPVRERLSTPHWCIDYIKNSFSVAGSCSGFKNIYISRNKGSRRRVVNEAEIIELLEKKGFKVIYAEEYSIAEIISIMDSAEVIVAPHGAGLSNIAFCREGTAVYELYSEHLSQEYWLFCKRLGLKYYGIECENTEGQLASELNLNYEDDFFKINFADIKANVAELNSKLDLNMIEAVI